ncbi:hypothetical protein quinque_008705 [Culex quinquefasciatus]
MLDPEPVFRGFLVSTITCQDCCHILVRHESFLDLTLPINLEKPQPPIRRKGSPESDYGNSGVPEGDEKGAVESDKDDNGMLDVEVYLTEDWQSKKIVTQNSNQSSGGRKSLTMRRKIRPKRLNRIWCVSCV